MPIRQTEFPRRPPRFDQSELAVLKSALDKNELWYVPTSSIVHQAMRAYAAKFRSRFAVATSSGTASLHVAVAACQMPPGSEVITTPITDIGTINAILYQNLIPVFADVDPDTACPTIESIQAALTPRTRAVVAVHLSGCPLDMKPIAAFCKANNLKLIEDCAQGLGATLDGAYIGTFGDFGCYSLNDQKHIISGEGGFILINNEAAYFLCHNYADKYYDRHKRGVRLHALAPNYRMSELDGAMASVQITKLDAIASRRRALGDRLNAELAAIPGVIPQKQPAGAAATYFFYLFRIDEKKLGQSRDEFVKNLRTEGLPAGNAYVAEPIYRSYYFLHKSFFPGGIWPAEVVSGQTYDFSKVSLPGAEQAVATGVSFQLHEGYSDDDISDCIKIIAKVAGTS